MNRQVSRWGTKSGGAVFGPVACALEFHVKQARKRNLTRNFSSEAPADAYGLRMPPPNPTLSMPALHAALEVEVRQLHEHTTERST